MYKLCRSCWTHRLSPWSSFINSSSDPTSTGCAILFAGKYSVPENDNMFLLDDDSIESGPDMLEDISLRDEGSSGTDIGEVRLLTGGEG